MASFSRASFGTLLLVIAMSCNRTDPSPSENSVKDSPAATASASATPSTATSSTTAPSVGSPPQPRAARPDDWFRDVTGESGIRFSYRNGQEGNQFTLLETVGGGVAMVDFDVDGDLDLFFCGGGRIAGSPQPGVSGLPPALYRNEGNWRFTDVTQDVGLDIAFDYSHGVTVADFDRNGFPDLFVTAYGQSRLLKNEQGKFRDVTEIAGLTFSTWSTAAACADIDRNGYPDLYVAGYVDWKLDQQRVCYDATKSIRDVCPPQDHPGTPDRLFRNRGDGTFEDVSAAAGIRDTDRGLGVLASDLNGDHWPDFYVANDGDPNRLLLGGPSFPWKDAGLWAGVATSESGLAEGSMGVDVADYNGDGRPDIFATNFELENNSLYRGERDGLFVHATLSAGLAGQCFPFVGFGTGFFDADLDGWQDLYICNGNVFYHLGQRGYYQRAFFYRNENGQRFREASEQCGPYFSVPHVGRGAAVGDLDNDGALDLVIVHQNDPVTVLRNERRPAFWTRVQLEGTTCDREAVGARVSASFRGRQLVHWIRSGAGYLSHSDQRIIFPLESNVALDVAVEWPTGVTEVFSGCRPGETNKLVEGHGQTSTTSKSD